MIRTASNVTQASIALLLISVVSTLSAQTLHVPGGTVGTSSNGNVGIGTASPAAKLDVQISSPYGQLGSAANIALRNSDTSAYNATQVAAFDANGNLTGGISFRNLGHGTSGYSDMMFSVRYSGTILTPLFLGSSGNVGIGTTSPAEKLDVNGNIKLGDSRSVSALVVGSFGHKIGRESQDGSLFIGGGQANIILQNNVGIGTTTPDAPLAVSGRIRSNSWHPYGSESNDLYVDVEPNTRILRTRNWNESSPNIAATGIHTGTGYFEGNVGIGTTNPTHKLAVNGTIKAKEVIVETTGWSDYVFADGYALAPLAEVEAHIKEHKHLPGIPSAAHVTDHGVSVGEMQAKLLAKIEELTLHQIAQEKILRAQKQQLETQSKRINELETFLR